MPTSPRQRPRANVPAPTSRAESRSTSRALPRYARALSRHAARAVRPFPPPPPKATTSPFVIASSLESKAPLTTYYLLLTTYYLLLTAYYLLLTTYYLLLPRE